MKLKFGYSDYETWKPTKILASFITFLLAIYLLSGIISIFVGIWKGVYHPQYVIATIKLSKEGPYSPNNAKVLIKSDRVMKKLLKENEQTVQNWRKNLKVEKIGDKSLQIAVKINSELNPEEAKEVTSVAVSNFLKEARNFYNQKQRFNSQKLKNYQALKKKIDAELKDSLNTEVEFKLNRKKMELKQQILKEKKQLYQQLPPKIEIKPHIITK